MTYTLDAFIRDAHAALTANNSPAGREQVRDELGISISAGAGTSKLVAQVATRQAKPGRHVYVPAGQEQAFLAPWPVRVLPGASSGAWTGVWVGVTGGVLLRAGRGRAPGGT